MHYNIHELSKEMNDVYVRTISSKSTKILNIRWGLTKIDKGSLKAFSQYEYHHMDILHKMHLIRYSAYNEVKNQPEIHREFDNNK